MSEILVWGDTETFGLNENTDPIIEIGFCITDMSLLTIDKRSWLIWGPDHEYRLDQVSQAEEDTGDAFVYNMHVKNNLFDDAIKWGAPLEEVEEEVLTWLKERVTPHREPLCGSSVHFDRKFLNAQIPDLNNFFHYRIIDNSTLKELCRRFNKRVYESVPTAREIHRVLPDLEDTILEFAHYRDEFLLW